MAHVWCGKPHRVGYSERNCIRPAKPRPFDSRVCVYVLLCLQHRPSTHQLSAKYAAMLPLAAADPNMDSKVKAARMLRTWVHERRAGVQAQMGAAARDAQEGGSTLQDLPEMMVPYGLYILAHHPDFPQVWP